MYKGLVASTGLAAMMMLGVVGAHAFVAIPAAQHGNSESAVLPAAMCGFRCEYGGRYIPGPPSVCYERGMRFCGPSRPYGDEGPRFYGRSRDYEGGCRTVTIERDDGTVRRIRRCD